MDSTWAADLVDRLLIFSVNVFNHVFFLLNIFGPLLKICLPLLKNIPIVLTKKVLIKLGLTTAAYDSRILGSGTLIILMNKWKML